MNEVTHVDFHKTYTTKTPLNFFRTMLVRNSIETCDNY